MYTLDQQIKDIETAENRLDELYDGRYTLYLCSTAKNINSDFYYFLQRNLKRLKKISPKSYETTITNVETTNTDLKPVWSAYDYQSRKQFLHDLKEDVIENG
jgi:hypothetical protein